MTDILITDTHFGIKQNSITWFNSQSNFIYKQLIPYIEDHKDVVRLIHLGDVFDSRSSISVLIAAKVKKIFTDLARVCGQVIVIGGNHDYYSPNSNEYNSIELVLGDVPGITLVTRDILIDGNNMYVPWYEYDVGVIENKVRFVMLEVMMFALGFSSVVSVYEIAKTAKSTKSNAIKREAEKITKKRK